MAAQWKKGGAAVLDRAILAAGFLWQSNLLYSCAVSAAQQLARRNNLETGQQENFLSQRVGAAPPAGFGFCWAAAEAGAG